MSIGASGELLISNPEGVQTLSARRVLIATGIRETTRAAHMTSGDRSVGILTTGALQAYIAFHGLMPFKRPLIVGSELVTMSAVLSCLGHGARPVAIIEQAAHSKVGLPYDWFPSMMGIPFHRQTSIMDILGQGRVEAVRIRRGGTEETIQCDGVLFSGTSTPEASLFQMSGLGLDQGSSGPAIDQYGRCENPTYFAAGNILRAVETGGWAFREGRAIGMTIAADLMSPGNAAEPCRVTYDAPIKLVVPSLIRQNASLPKGLKAFQVRVSETRRGCIRLLVDNRVVWQRAGLWKPEARILAFMPDDIGRAQSVHFEFAEE